MNGLFLQGGGAKGAFQAGVVYGLHEGGISFNIISGTSIGAINSYFIGTNNVDKLKDVWTNINYLGSKDKLHFQKVFDNQTIIDLLRNYDGENKDVESIFVNYVAIENSLPKEIVVDIVKGSKEDALEAIRYSSLLPAKMDREMTIDEIIESFDSKKVFEVFRQDVIDGEYNGYKLDGGILNNNFVNPFVKNKVDKLYLVTLDHDYQVPDYIRNNYEDDELVIIRPNTPFEKSDTLRFNKEFCTRIFDEGYKLSKNIKEI